MSKHYPSKTAHLRAVLSRRWLTTLESVEICGINSLAQRVSVMRRKEGLTVLDKWVKSANGSRFKAYHIPRAVRP